MNYKETLDFAEENDIDWLQLQIANEVDIWFGGDEYARFETICRKINTCYLSTRTVTVSALVSAFYKLVTSTNLQEALDTNKFEIIAMAV